MAGLAGVAGAPGHAGQVGHVGHPGQAGDDAGTNHREASPATQKTAKLLAMVPADGIQRSSNSTSAGPSACEVLLS